jgi:hypothetical protein
LRLVNALDAVLEQLVQEAAQLHCDKNTISAQG